MPSRSSSARRADAGELQQLRGVERAAAEDHLAAAPRTLRGPARVAAVGLRVGAVGVRLVQVLDADGDRVAVRGSSNSTRVTSAPVRTSAGRGAAGRRRGSARGRRCAGPAATAIGISQSPSGGLRPRQSFGSTALAEALERRQRPAQEVGAGCAPRRS